MFNYCIIAWFFSRFLACAVGTNNAIYKCPHFREQVYKFLYQHQLSLTMLFGLFWTALYCTYISCKSQTNNVESSNEVNKDSTARRHCSQQASNVDLVTYIHNFFPLYSKFSLYLQPFSGLQTDIISGLHKYSICTDNERYKDA